MREYLYLKELKKRRAEDSLRANVIFGQTLGWVLTLVGGFRYFILYEKHAFYMLMVGNALLLLGLGLPQSLELPQRLMKKVAEYLSSVVLKIVLAFIYLLVITPFGFVGQKIHGQKPFYYWQGIFNGSIEGWTPKVSSDEGRILQKSGFASHHAIQLMQHFAKNGELVIMPGLIVILLLGLIAVLAQSTVVAPMIYTLF